MSEITQRYVSLEQSIATDPDALRGLFEEVDFNLLDLHGTLDFETLETLRGLQVGLAKSCCEFDQAAWQTAYRAFLFAYEVAELAGEHDFSLQVPNFSADDLNVKEFRWQIGHYLEENPETAALLDYFIDEIDITYTGQYERIARLVGGLAFTMIDGAMREGYLAQKASLLEKWLD